MIVLLLVGRPTTDGTDELDFEADEIDIIDDMETDSEHDLDGYILTNKKAYFKNLEREIAQNIF